MTTTTRTERFCDGCKAVDDKPDERHGWATIEVHTDRFRSVYTEPVSLDVCRRCRRGLERRLRRALSPTTPAPEEGEETDHG